MAIDLRPMLATPSTAAGGKRAIDINDLRPNHVFDLKMDGVRAFLRWNGSSLTITNRNQIDVTWKYPELVAAAEAHFDLPVWLDGEIVCNSGRFEDTLTRDKQSTVPAALAAAARLPVTFHAFDWPAADMNVWDMRRGYLDEFLSDLPDNVPFMGTPWSYTPDFLEKTRAAGLEGVIAKHLNSQYQFGARSKQWIKFKNLHRVTCIVTGYEPGTGARAHFGKMNLAMIDPAGQIVPCGSVGTGFTLREIDELKELLDNQSILVVEIETLNRTSGGTLRFPVYKGIRSDLGPLDCTIDQLATLPAC